MTSYSLKSCPIQRLESFCIERIVKETSEILNNTGYLFIEHGYDQSDFVVSIFETCGFSQIRTFKDLNGDDRVCLGKLNRC